MRAVIENAATSHRDSGGEPSLSVHTFRAAGRHRGDRNSARLAASGRSIGAGSSEEVNARIISSKLGSPGCTITASRISSRRADGDRIGSAILIKASTRAARRWAYNSLPFLEEDRIHDLGKGMAYGGTPDKKIVLAEAAQSAASIFLCPSRRAHSQCRSLLRFSRHPMPISISISVSTVWRGDYCAMRAIKCGRRTCHAASRRSDERFKISI